MLAAGGYRAAALDLRGYGASDKPPRGYDTWTSCRDVASVIRSLGARSAVVVGQGWGGWVAWAMPTLEPEVTSAIGALSAAHPRAFRRASVRRRAQARANHWIAGLQRPFLPERIYGRPTGAVERFLREGASPGGIWPSVEEASAYSDAMTLPFVAHSAAEYYRWFGRSQLRPDGWRFQKLVERPVTVPVLTLQGADDPLLLPATAAASADWVSGPLTSQVIPGAGHFLSDEAPGPVAEHLLDWLGGLEPGPGHPRRPRTDQPRWP